MVISEEQARLAEEYLRGVLAKNQQLNLTAINSFDEGMLLHVEDSLAGIEEVQAAPAGKLVDLGTGGGFPGVILNIATNREVLLVDSTRKKLDAVAAIVSSLGLRSIRYYAGRIEDLGREQKASFSVATARALAPLPVLLEYAAPLLNLGGRLVAYKSNDFAEELERATTLELMLGMKHVSTREFLLSDQITKRTLIVFEKIAEPKIDIPRRVGVAQKRPLA